MIPKVVLRPKLQGWLPTGWMEPAPNRCCFWWPSPRLSRWLRNLMVDQRSIITFPLKLLFLASIIFGHPSFFDKPMLFLPSNSHFKQVLSCAFPLTPSLAWKNKVCMIMWPSLKKGYTPKWLLKHRENDNWNGFPKLSDQPMYNPLKTL